MRAGGQATTARSARPPRVAVGRSGAHRADAPARSQLFPVRDPSWRPVRPESAMTSMCARGPSPRVISRRPARLIAPSWGRGDVRRPEHTGSLIGSPPLLGQRGKPARVQPGPAQRLRTDRLVARVDFTGGGADAVVGVSPPVPVGTAM